MLGEIPDDVTVWLMTISTPRGNQDSENTAIGDAVARWAPSLDVRLLDGRGLVVSTPGLIGGDGVHLTEAGRLAMRDLIGSALDAS